MPNERWQADITHWRLADGTGVEILNIEDDHSRLDLASDARLTTTGHDVVTSFRRAFARHGIPARVLTDNGAVFTGKPRRGGRVALELELDLLGVRLDHSRAYHPQTCGKVERFHQTQKKWLAAQPPATSLASCNGNWTGSGAPTTPSARTARSAAAPPPRPTPPDPRPCQPAHESSGTTASDATGPTPSASSRCATKADYATSAWAENTHANAS